MTDYVKRESSFNILNDYALSFTSGTTSQENKIE